MNEENAPEVEPIADPIEEPKSPTDSQGTEYEHIKAGDLRSRDLFRTIRQAENAPEFLLMSISYDVDETVLKGDDQVVSHVFTNRVDLELAQVDAEGKFIRHDEGWMFLQGLDLQEDAVLLLGAVRRDVQ